MPENISKILDQLHALQRQMETEFEKRRVEFKYSLRRHKVVFDEEIRRRHRALRTGFWAYLRRARFLTLLTAPVIYSLIIPLLLLDLFVTFYQAICFPVYGITKVRHRDFIALDHYTLQYLNGLQKLNCIYCSYGNGLLAFTAEIAARTEQYWCPIKHSRRMKGSHDRYPQFLEFGDGEKFQSGLKELRDQLKQEKDD